MDWPPPHGQGAGAAGGGYPPASWPSKDQLDYTSRAITTLFLVLALPYVVGKLLTNPAQVLTGMGRQARPPT